MNIIEKRELRNELKYKDTVILTYNIKYPVITFSNYDIGKTSFNQYNLEKAKKLEHIVVTELYEDAKKTYDYNISNGYPVMVYEVILDYTITFNDDYIVSLFYDQYEFTGGAHGNTIRTSQTWDLCIGKQLPLSYFYPDNPNYVTEILREINNQIKYQIEAGNNYYFDNYCELVLETFKLENYYLTPGGIVVYFQQYDIAPYSSGIREFYLPF